MIMEIDKGRRLASPRRNDFVLGEPARRTGIKDWKVARRGVAAIFVMVTPPTLINNAFSEASWSA